MVDVYHVSTTRHALWGGSPRWLMVVVHETIDEFQKAAAKYQPDADWTDTAGGFHPAISKEPFVGVMRLNKEQFDNETIVHECVHAGVAIYRSSVKQGVVLGREVCDNEEALCYIVGDLASEVFGVLKGV